MDHRVRLSGKPNTNCSERWPHSPGVLATSETSPIYPNTHKPVLKLKEPLSMAITDEQLHEYEDRGLLFLPGYFSGAEVEIMKAELPRLFSDSTPRRVMEEGGRDVRSVY